MPYSSRAPEAIAIKKETKLETSFVGRGNGIDRLDNSHFTMATGTTHISLDYILRMPFDVLSNDCFRKYCADNSFCPIPTTSDVNSMLKQLGTKPPQNGRHRHIPRAAIQRSSQDGRNVSGQGGRR